MKIKNVTADTLVISDLNLPSYGLGKPQLGPGQEALVFDEDAQRSAQLGALITAGKITKLNDDEPTTGSPATSSGIITSPTQVTPIAGTGNLVHPFTNFTGQAGRVKRTYSNEQPGFEIQVESIEGMGPRPSGSDIISRTFGLPYPTMRYSKAQRLAIPSMVSFGIANVFKATVGAGTTTTGANYIPQLDSGGLTTKTSLQHAHDDMETNGTAVLVESRSYSGLSAGTAPVLEATKNFRLVGAWGNGAIPTYSSNTALVVVNGSPGQPAIRVTNLGPTTVTLFLSNIRVVGFNAPAIELVGNVAVRANNCSFAAFNSSGSSPFSTIRMATTNNAISILTDCHLHNATGGGHMIQYEGSGGTNWMRLDGGTHRSDSNGSFVNVVDGFSNLELNGVHLNIFSPNFVVKNTMGTPITIQTRYSSTNGLVTPFDTNVTLDKSGEF